MKRTLQLMIEQHEERQKKWEEGNVTSLLNRQSPVSSYGVYDDDHHCEELLISKEEQKSKE